MALFGFADISFNKGTTDRRGPLAPLTKSQFERTTLRYPLDVGNYDKAHYVVFYIREQKNTSYSRGPNLDDGLLGSSGGVRTDVIRAPGQAASNFGNEILGKVNSGLNQINQATGGALSGITNRIGNAASGIVGNINNVFGQGNAKFGGSSAQTTAVIDNSIKKITGGGLSFLRTTKLTKDAIALYMPDTLMFNYSQSYDQLSLGGEMLGQALAAGRSAVEAYMKSGDTSDFGGLAKAAGAGAAAAGKSLALTAGATAAEKLGGNTGQAAFAALTGSVRNPMLEMIYKSPNFRTFQFDFLFYPRDEREALEVQRILERFRFHQAPELVKDASGFLVPPSEFDIRFYYGGAENNNIPSIATCVLTTIDINYAPNGFTAYEVPGENKPALGRTGMPVAIQMTLQFQEITYLTKSDLRQDLAQTDTLANKAS
jgi:hypothetical protein